jgi:hypothetical protein
MQTRSKKPPARPAKKLKPADDFVSVARRLDADEDKARFEAKLARLSVPKVVRKKSDK